ncbi:MAG: response regulator [Lachnospiraceae bacterium]|nr:response regulator [Lachnospiraceae bacterium]
MYKVLFADDEILTREAIAENTPWEEAGFTLIGTAQNGKEAIELMEVESPDLLITDICMPVMDGIELSGYVKSHFEDVQVVILSGYDEFEYAKQALKHGVVEYLLKPITAVELKNELMKVKEKIDKKYFQKNYNNEIMHAYEKSKRVVREHFLNRLLEGTISKEYMKEQLTYFHLEQPGRYQAVTFVEISNYKELAQKYSEISESLLQFAISNITNEIIEEEKEIICFQNTNDACVVIFTAETEKALKEEIWGIGNRIRKEMQNNMNIEVCIAVGETVHSPQKWKKSYESAKHAIEYKYLEEEPEFLYDKKYAGEERLIGEEPKADIWVDELLLLIKTNQGDKLREVIKLRFKDLCEARCERQKAYLHIQNCILSIRIKLEEEKIDIPESAERESAFIDCLFQCGKLSEIEKEFTIFCLDITKKIANKKVNSNQTIIELALDFVNKNYDKPELSLNMVCEYLSMSISYFSMIFKNYTGETFIELLTRIRMERAKKLMVTTCMKNYEVAIAVGYNDPHYFGATFKKYTGMTPSVYAKTYNDMRKII